MKKKILIMVSNTTQCEATKRKTGIWISELTHFYDFFIKKGFSQVIASPRGGEAVIDPRSLQFPFVDYSVKKRMKDISFLTKLDNTEPAQSLDFRDFCAIYFVGGHGAMFDFPGNEIIEQISRAIYEQGGIVSSVCHGYCALPSIRLSNGEFLITGRKITGYSWTEEVLAGVSRHVPYSAEREVKNKGARYMKSLVPFYPHVESDRRVITGQNPFSTKLTAKKLYEELQKLQLTG